MDFTIVAGRIFWITAKQISTSLNPFFLTSSATTNWYGTFYKCRPDTFILNLIITVILPKHLFYLPCKTRGGMVNSYSYNIPLRDKIKFFPINNCLFFWSLQYLCPHGQKDLYQGLVESSQTVQFIVSPTSPSTYRNNVIQSRQLSLTFIYNMLFVSGPSHIETSPGV